MKNPKVRQIILPLITAMIWGSSFVTQSLSAGHLGCFSFNALRSIPAALALLLLLLVVRRIRPREKYTAEEKRALLRGGLICGFFLTLGVNLQQFGIETTTAGKAGFITTLYIVLVPVFSIMLGKRRRRAPGSMCSLPWRGFISSALTAAPYRSAAVISIFSSAPLPSLRKSSRWIIMCSGWTALRFPARSSWWSLCSRPSARSSSASTPRLRL